MANWWEELQKNNSQKSMSLADYGKTFDKSNAALSPAPNPAGYTSTGNAVYRHAGSTASDTGSAELFNVPFRILSEQVTTAGIVAQAVLRDPSRYVGNTTEYKNLWKGAYQASLGDRDKKAWWQGGEDPVTIGQMYSALFDSKAPDLLNKDAVNQYYETGDLFDSKGGFTSRWNSGAIDLIAMVLLDPLNFVGGGGISKAAKGAEALSAGARAVEHLTLQQSIEAGLRGSTAAGLAPGTTRASETALAQMLREGPRGTVTNTTNPLRRERIRNEIARFASEVDFYDKVNLLDDSGSLLKYGSEDYLSSSRMLHELFAPIEDVRFPDPSIHGIKDLLNERDFRYFVLDAETFATDGTAIMRWSYEKNRWLPVLTFPKITLKKVFDTRASFTENIGNQIKSYDVGAEKVAVSPHVKEMVLGNLTDGPFGSTADSLLPTGSVDAAYKTPDSVFTIPAVDATGVRVPQPISAGARFSHVVIDGRKVYVLYDTQYNRVYTLQSYRTAKNINTGIEPKAKFEDVDDATIADTNTGETVEGEVIDERAGTYDTSMVTSEDEMADFGKDNLFTPENAPRGERVTGVETKQRTSANRKLVWVRADWFDFAKVQSYEFKFVDGVTGRVRKIQVPSKFKLVNASEVSNGARPIFIEYVKKPGAFVPNPVQHTVNRAGEVVPVAKAVAEDVAFKNETAVAAKLQADLQASIQQRLTDPEYINEMRQLHSSEYLAEEPRKPVDYSIWYDYKPNADGTVNITAMARRKEMSGFEDYAEEVSTKDFVLHTWENVPESVIKRYTYQGYDMYSSRGGAISPIDEKLDDAGTNLWQRTIGNADEPAVSFNIDDIYHFGYRRPYDSRTVKPSVKEGESLADARGQAFEKEKIAIRARRDKAIKELQFIEKKYPDWESTLTEATSLEARWREIDKQLENLKSKKVEVGKKEVTDFYNRQELIAKLEKEKQSIEETLNSAEHTASLNSTKIKYAIRAKSLRMYLKHIDSIRPFYVDINHYLKAYMGGDITRSSDIKRTEQWLLNFEDFLNNSLGTKFSAQKALEDLASKEETITPAFYGKNAVIENAPAIDKSNLPLINLVEKTNIKEPAVKESIVNEPAQTFYHGTSAELKVGDIIEPRTSTDEFGNIAFASKDLDITATHASQTAFFRDKEVGYIYRVEPVDANDVINDPRGSEGYSVGSTKGFRVVEKMYTAKAYKEPWNHKEDLLLETSKSSANKIDFFRGEHAFLSNMFKSPITIKGETYPTAEHLFQAAKFEDEETRKLIAKADGPAAAKRIGKSAKGIIPGWNSKRVGIMEQILRAKFEQNPDLIEKLVATGDTELIEGNTWGDKFWGQVNGEGENNLGKILMKLREEFRNA